MISRRILRIKALLALYAYNRRGDEDIVKAEKELVFSIGKTYELYHLILILLLELSDIAGEKIEMALKKKMPTHDDLNPNRKFTENKLLAKLSENQHLNKYIHEYKISWANYRDVPRGLYNKLITLPEYVSYINSTEDSFTHDRDFIATIVRVLIQDSEELASNLEEQSIYWNDDLPFISAMIEKSIRKINSGSKPDHPLMPLYSNPEDEVFVRALIRKAILNFEKTAAIVDKNTTNWEIERIALMDRLVMQLAISEMIAFEEIPLKVTLNEYIDISKYYCTSKSNTFVNGILDKVVKVLVEEAEVVKTGRGLIDESVAQTVKKSKNKK